MTTPEAELLSNLWWQGVDAVRGDVAVARALNDTGRPDLVPDQILAVGKAASAMARAALDAFPDTPALVVTKFGHGEDLNARTIEAAHPVPDAASLTAGRALIKAVEGMAAGSHLLLLVSGGASALAEYPVTGWDLAALQKENARLLASGLDIHAMNARRREFSRIKGGGLLSRFKGARVTTLAISDVQGDSLDVIGSGIGAAPEGHRFAFEPRIVASNSLARAAIRDAALAQGLTIRENAETLYDDLPPLTRRIGETLRNAPKGLILLGGEPTIRLPANPGRGGRNQALALGLAREIAGQNGLAVLVAGSDGTDGPTKDAGGMITGQTWAAEAQAALDKADSGTFLEQAGALFTTGPTGTNVMDLLIALKT